MASTSAGKPEWEFVGDVMYRFPVPGGWIYRDAGWREGGMVFVPEPPPVNTVVEAKWPKWPEH